MSNKPPKPAPTDVVKALEERIAVETGMLETAKSHLRVAQIGMAQGRAGADEEADALSQGVRTRKDRIASLRETLAEAQDAVRAINADATAKAEQREIEASRGRARKMLEAASALDDALVAVGLRWRDFELAHVAFWSGTSVALRQSALIDYMQGHSSVKPLLRLRLGFDGCIDGQMVWDRTITPTKIEEHMRGAVGDLLPARGRPRGDAPKQEAA